LNKRGHVLLISSNKVWRKNVGNLLKKEVSELVEAGSIEEAVEAPSRIHIDIILLDLTSRDEPAAQRCRSLKNNASFRDVPVVAFVSEHQLAALDVSADVEDIIIQRDSADEALFRIKRVLWKKTYSRSAAAITIEDLVIDLENYEASIKGQSLYLTFKEFELLKFFLLNRGRVFTRDDLLDKVWGYDNYVGTRTVDIHIQRLRHKLGTPVGDMIVTIRNVGYKFAAD
jgi:DNA-binding response OmpR family regulator